MKTPTTRPELERYVDENILSMRNLTGKELISALEFAGLAVVPRELTEEMIEASLVRTTQDTAGGRGIQQFGRRRFIWSWPRVLAAGPYREKSND